MAVILGYEIADDWYSYHTIVLNSYDVGCIDKWWQCPLCKIDRVFTFRGAPPWPPLSIPCPSCLQESPIPWPSPPMVTWTCQNCGHVQMTSRRRWEQRYKWKVICNKCGKSADSTRGVIDDIGDVVGLGFDVVEEFAEGVRRFFGWETAAAQKAELDRKNLERAKRAERAFDRFLKKVPQLRAEQAKLAEEEKQRAALEAKARQEELKLLKRQARTAVGLKRMKPTNFELAVASLYLKLGYKVYVTPTSGDKGIDLVAVKDKERIAVQCKRYKRLVPVSQVRDFYGSFVGTYTRGIFVTSSAFSRATQDWTGEREGLELVDGQQLAKLFVEHDPKIVRNVEKWKERSPSKE